MAYVPVRPVQVVCDSCPSFYFKVFFCVVAYGLFHGLCYLPVILSVIGPAPYDSAQSHEHKTNHLSSAHPSDFPGEDVIYEMAMTNGKKTPIRDGKQSAQNDTQNVEYTIPPIDYEGKACTFSSEK